MSADRDQAADFLTWLGSSWATLVAFVTSVGAASTWMFRSRRRKAHRAGF